MDAITALTSRTSHPKVRDEAPSPEQLEILLQAAHRAADHGRLKPYRFIGISGDARQKLGELLAEAVVEGTDDTPDFEKFVPKAFRAPLVIAVVCSPKEHPKVPEIEQVIAAGCAAQMMLTAAHAQGLGAMWRSGSPMFTETMAQGLGLQAHESLVGFVYVGQALREAPRVEAVDVFERWAELT